MNNRIYKWVLPKKSKNKDVVEEILASRGIITKKDKEEYLSPTHPEDITLKSLGINPKAVIRAINRIVKAKENGEDVVVYGDYDADGITGTAILWETLYAYGLKVLPFIPDRFTEGYGLNIESIKKLKEKNPNLKLVITVDHGIVSGEKVDTATEIGIDTIITDHHQIGKTIPKAFEIIHTTAICGSAVSWIFSRELRKKLGITPDFGSGLELAAIGTIGDQMILLGPNRSFAKYGLIELNKTKRPGLIHLIRESGLTLGEIGTFEINFALGPRINAAGRVSHAIQSLQLICTKKEERALELSRHLNNVNTERQNVLEDIFKDAKERLKENKNKVLIISGKDYSEGIIGLAASRLVEEYYRPVIVLSEGKNISKASARSVGGFNIIEAIRKLEDLYHDGGGHPMAAGFSIDTKNIKQFEKRINENSENLLTEEILTRKINVDSFLKLSDISDNLTETILKFEPYGNGNPAPVFIAEKVKIVDFRLLGKENNHLKLKLEDGDATFEAIYFRYYGETDFSEAKLFDFIFALDKNTFRGVTTTQLKIKDFRVHE